MRMVTLKKGLDICNFMYNLFYLTYNYNVVLLFSFFTIFLLSTLLWIFLFFVDIIYLREVFYEFKSFY